MSDNQDNERPRYTVIYYGVMRALKISANEYMVLDTVYHLSAKHGYCYKSSDAIALDIGLTARGVRKLLQRLIDRGLLVRSAAGLVCGDAYLAIAYTETVERNKVPQVRNKVPKSGTKFPVAEQSTSKSYSKEEQKNNTTSGKPDTAREILEFYNHTFRRKQQALPPRLAKIKTRLRTYTADQLKQAIVNASRNDFFNGGGSSGWVGDIDYLMRDDAKVEKYLTPVKQQGYDPFADLK